MSSPERWPRLPLRRTSSSWAEVRIFARRAERAAKRSSPSTLASVSPNPAAEEATETEGTEEADEMAAVVATTGVAVMARAVVVVVVVEIAKEDGQPKSTRRTPTPSPLSNLSEEERHFLQVSAMLNIGASVR